MALGAVEVGFTVFSDFMSYRGGVYKHLSGAMEGGHAVKIVGWENSSGEEAWIVQNSWGASWGEDGFFRISMRNSGTDIAAPTTGGAFNCGDLHRHGPSPAPSPTPPRPSPSPTPSPAPDQCALPLYALQNKVDCKGQNIALVHGVYDTDACCAKCAETAGCKSWTLFTHTGHCHLKSGCREPEHNAEAVSSPPPGPAPRPTPGPTPSPGPSPGPTPAPCKDLIATDECASAVARGQCSL